MYKFFSLTGLVSIFFLAVSALVGCGGDSPSKASSKTRVSKAESANSETTKGASCVAKYADSPCEIFTDKLIRTTLSDVPQNAEKDEYSGAFHSCSYKWPSDRTSTMKLMGQTVDVEEDNQVSLSWIETYKKNPQQMFRRAYLPTEQEQQRAKMMFNKQLEKKSAELGLDKSSKKIAKSMGNSLVNSTKFSPVEGIGTMASWESAAEGQLHVLDGDTKFKISTNLSKDTSEDRKFAVELAKAVMAACK